MGESRKLLTPLPTRRAIGPAGVLEPGMFRIPAAAVGEVAWLALLSRTYPKRTVFMVLGLNCQLSEAFMTSPRCGVATKDFGCPFSMPTSPEPVVMERK